MNRAEAKAIIRDEDLQRWMWYVPSGHHPDCVTIQPDGAHWIVLSTNERGTHKGVARYDIEEEALDDFIGRLRAMNRSLRRGALDYYPGALWGNPPHSSGADIDTVEP